MTDAPVVDPALVTVANSGPAAWANRFVIAHGDHMVRIAFLEQESSGADRCSFRSAVVITREHAIQLTGLLTKLDTPNNPACPP